MPRSLLLFFFFSIFKSWFSIYFIYRNENQNKAYKIDENYYENDYHKEKNHFSKSI